MRNLQGTDDVSALDMTNALITSLDIPTEEREASYRYLSEEQFTAGDIIDALRACTTRNFNIPTIEKNIPLFRILLMRYQNFKATEQHDRDFIHNLCRNNNLYFLSIFLEVITTDEEFLAYTQILQREIDKQFSALMIACLKGHVGCVRLLLQKCSELGDDVLGTIINERNWNGFTPLRMTLHCRDMMRGVQCMQEILNAKQRKIIIPHGIHRELRISLNQPLYEFACMTVGDMSVKIHESRLISTTPLYVAIQKGNVGAVRLLLDRCAKRKVKGTILSFTMRAQPRRSALNLKQEIAQNLNLSLHNVHVSVVFNSRTNLVALLVVIIDDEQRSWSEQIRVLINAEFQAENVFEIDAIGVAIETHDFATREEQHQSMQRLAPGAAEAQRQAQIKRLTAEHILHVLLSKFAVDRDLEPQIFEQVMNKLSSSFISAPEPPTSGGTGETTDSR